MIRFIAEEMHACRRQWIALGVFLAVAVCLLCLSIGFIAAGAPYADDLDFGLRDIGEEYISLGGMQLAFIAFGVLAIVPAVVSTSIAVDSPRIARWQLAGASVRQSQGLYWCSLVIDAVIFSILGGLVAWFLWPAYSSWALRVSFPSIDEMHESISAIALPIGIAAGIAVTALAGAASMRSISHIDIATVVRDTGLSRTRHHPVRLLLGIAVAVGIITGYVAISKQPSTISSDTLDGLMAAYWGCALGWLLALALCESAVVPLAVAVVSRLIPQSGGLGSFLACGSARRRIRMSTAMVTPICVAAGTVGAIMGLVRQIRNVSRARGVPESELQVTPAGQIVFEFMSPIILAAVAAFCIIVITGAQRKTDTALLMVAGVPRRAIIASGFVEAFVYSLVAAILTVAILEVNALAIGAALGAGPVPGAGYAGINSSAFCIIAAGFALLAILLVSILALQTQRDPLTIVRATDR
ncbi:putative ABC transport system permease protein [Pseudoscardovia suis]|uniref:ABC transporter permease n=2 Tax=Pseudoscardovia suis TaxID=987063 RepID=A0A261EQK8_9BIFI|nr:ABC transporter permease [Pseudoscardovia suis]PJJ65991.1 putative ABC transport system permease protein [Pseudoscardovia suis]